MAWIKISPYGKDAYTYWFNGVYKIVSYNKGQYHAFLIENGDKNWGNYFCNPPETFHNPHACKPSKGWTTLKDAKLSCRNHSKDYQPTPKTVKRALEIQTTLIEKSVQYA